MAFFLAPAAIQHANRTSEPPSTRCGALAAPWWSYFFLCAGVTIVGKSQKPYTSQPTGENSSLIPGRSANVSCVVGTGRAWIGRRRICRSIG
jgi:hypothetical protein